MTTYFVTRHPGAKAWAEEAGINIDICLEHLQINQLKTGDKVLGTLPVNLVAELNAKGVRYFHLTLPMPAELRGREITKDIMKQLGAKLEEYSVKKI